MCSELYAFLSSLNTAPDEIGKSIVEQSGAVASINGSFFNSYNAFQHPSGHVMVDGEFLCGVSGISFFRHHQRRGKPCGLSVSSSPGSFAATARAGPLQD